MTAVAALPRPVLDRLRTLHGQPLAVEALPGGMSFSSVYRVRFATSAIIAKCAPRATELAFYQHAAPRLRAAGIALPACDVISDTPGGGWLLLEEVPPLRSARTVAAPDRRMLELLAKLHAASREWQFDVPPPVVERWTDALSAEALSLFPARAAAELLPLLQRLRRQVRHQGVDWCWISGDPNRSNWGERDDGEMVLFDWERFRRGLPATDLAIVLAGLGDADAFNDVAARYGSIWPVSAGPLPWSTRVLAHQIALEKVFTVVEFLAHAARGALRPTAGLLSALLERVPPWLHGLSAAL